MQFEFRCNLKLCRVSSPTNLGDPGCIWMVLVCVFSLKPNVNALICKKLDWSAAGQLLNFSKAGTNIQGIVNDGQSTFETYQPKLNHDLSWFYHDPLPGQKTPRSSPWALKRRPTRCWVHGRPLAIGCVHTPYVSLDWFKGKFTGNHGFYHQI